MVIVGLGVDSVPRSLLLVVASVLGWLIGILTTHNIRPGLYSDHYVTALIFYRYTLYTKSSLPIGLSEFWESEPIGTWKILILFMTKVVDIII